MNVHVELNMRLFQVQRLMPKGIQNNKRSREPAPRNLENFKKLYFTLTLGCLPCSCLLKQTNKQKKSISLQAVFC